MKRLFVSLMLAALALLVGLPIHAQSRERSPASVYLLDQSSSAVSVTGTVADALQASINIPSGVIGENGMLRVTASWSYPSTANTKTFRIRYGGQGFWSSIQTTSQSLTSIAMIRGRGVSGQVAGGANTTGYGATANPTMTFAVNTMQDKPLEISCQLASAAETCTLEGYTVELLRP